MRSIDQQLKSALLNGLAVARWGTAWPKRARPYRSPAILSFDPHDPRARRKLIHDTLRRKVQYNRRFWAQAMADLAPDTALDIGLNYGECLFTTYYPAGCRALGFEANPRLRTYLEQTHQTHPQHEQIEMHFGLVGAEHGGEGDFHIDTCWSGSSSAVPLQADDPRYQVVKMPLISVDGVAADRVPKPGKVIFKIDVEGYESMVLQEMKKTFDRCDWAMGLVEINEVSLRAVGVELASYYEQLQEQFSVFGFTRSKRLVDLRGQPLQTLRDITVKKHSKDGGGVGGDLVLVHGPVNDDVERFLGSWS